MKKVILFFAVIFMMSFQDAQAQNYQTAVGARLGWGLSGTVKHFISETSALEGIVNFRSFGGGIPGFSFTSIRVNALYQIHNDFSSITEGLNWYYGAGPYIGFYSGDFVGDSFFVGASGNLGLDYKIPSAPINISVDWLPSFQLVGGTGFSAEAGGLAVRYTF